MTTVAWDGKSLAADKQGTVCGSIKRTVTKIHRVGDAICGIAGDASDGMAVIAWIQAGALHDTFPQFAEDRGAQVLVIRSGECWLYGDGPIPVRFEDQHFAIGSGSEFALGAMLAGKSAKQAVEIASRLDPYTGLGVDVLRP